MIYSPHAPYEVLATKTMDFETIQKMRRFARYWDLVANSGNFVQTTRMIWGEGSAFCEFMKFCGWLYERTGERTHGIALGALAEQVFDFLIRTAGVAREIAAEALSRDWIHAGRRERPEFLKPYVHAEHITVNRASMLPRQARHLMS